MEFTYTQEEESSKGLFVQTHEGTVTARLTYSRMDDNNIIVDHTAVDPASTGMGAGKAIVFHLVEWARENNQKILPLCPFAKGVFDRTPEIRDVLRG